MKVFDFTRLLLYCIYFATMFCTLPHPHCLPVVAHTLVTIVISIVISLTSIQLRDTPTLDSMLSSNHMLETEKLQNEVSVKL